jgi:CheY-like chemotaxis protein
MKKILIVDDEPAVLFALSEALADRRRGVKVATATNGNEAVAILESEKVDLVVTDLRMPEMDGFELMAWLRRSFPHLPVIVMTAYLAESARLGVGVDILEKPFDLAILKKKTSDMLRQSVKGRVENISLSSFLQLLEIERKTCTLSVTSGEHGGRLYFRGGKLVGARLAGDPSDGLEDQAAALEIVTWEHADIEIADGCPVPGPELEGGLRFFLLEGMRLKDERERHAPNPPGIAQETDDAIEALLSPDTGAFARPAGVDSVDPIDPVDPAMAMERAETIREALERGRGVDGSLATLLVETASGNLVAAAIGAKGVDLEVAARATAEFARQKPRVEETIGLKDAVEEVLLTSARRYYLLRPVGSEDRMFLLLVLDRSKANLTAAQEELAAIERELTEKALV